MSEEEFYSKALSFDEVGMQVDIFEKEKIKYQQQLDQLTNNWNEVRQHIKEYLEEWENSDDEWVKGKCDMARDILYDMEEIKDKR